MFDTERVSAGAWEQAGAEFGVEVKEEFLRTIRGTNTADAIRRMHAVFGEDFDAWGLRTRKQEIFLELLRTQGVPVKPGLHELLAYLKEHGYKVALATASNLEYSRRNLEETGVLAYFDEMATGDMVAHAKPDPALFLKAAELLGEEPGHCMVLEDSLNGVEAGLRGGFVTVMVPDLTQPDEELRRRVHRVCPSLHEVIGLLEELSEQGE